MQLWWGRESYNILLKCMHRQAVAPMCSVLQTPAAVSLVLSVSWIVLSKCILGIIDHFDSLERRESFSHPPPPLYISKVIFFRRFQYWATVLFVYVHCEHG